MGLFKIFFGKDPEGYEKKGDHCFKAEAYGDAKLEYEAGLNRLEKKDSDNSILKRRLQEKILKSREALALHHKLRGEEIMESEYYEGAEDVFRLALELTENPALKAELQERLQEIRDHYTQEETMDSQDLQFENHKNKNHLFYDMDYQKYFSEKHKGPIGFYIYDGNHSKENQFNGLQVAEPFFSKDCLILIDDINWASVMEGTEEFIKQSSHTYEVIAEQPTIHNYHPTFWNGITLLKMID